MLPGVGAFADCRRGLDAVARHGRGHDEAVRRKGGRFLGICVGMQLMASAASNTRPPPASAGSPATCTPIEPDDPGLKIPHMGWNTLHPQREHPLLDGIATGPNGLHAYFVHSYALDPENQDEVWRVTDYGGPVTAVVARDNMAGTQFHPEKSQKLGLALIANFLRWRP